MEISVIQTSKHAGGYKFHLHNSKMIHANQIHIISTRPDNNKHTIILKNIIIQETIKCAYDKLPPIIRFFFLLKNNCHQGMLPVKIRRLSYFLKFAF